MKVEVISEFIFSKKHLREVMNRIKSTPAKAVIGWMGESEKQLLTFLFLSDTFDGNT